MYQDVVLVTQELMVNGEYINQPDPKGALVCTPGVQVGPAWLVLARFAEEADLSSLETYLTQEALLLAHPEFQATFQPITYTDSETGEEITTQVTLGSFFDEAPSLRQKRQRVTEAEDALGAAQRKFLLTNPLYKAAALELARARKELNP